MSRFLITVWPFTGHIHPNLAVAEALRDRGHEVAFLTGSQARGTVEAAGFTCLPFRAIDEAAVEKLVLSSEGILSQRRRPLRMKAMWRQWVLDTIPAQVSDVNDALDEWGADAIICDPTMWGPFLVVHETKRIPVAIFSLIPACYLSGRDAPILGLAMPRPTTRMTRMVSTVLRKVSRWALRDITRAANLVRSTYRLPPMGTTVTDFAGRLPLYLVPGSPDFDYSRTDLPRSVKYVGPCLWRNTREGVPAWIEALSKDRPLVYVSEGTVKVDSQMLRAAAQGLANLPIHVLIATGRHRDPETLDLGPRPLAPNIHVERWIPLDPIVNRLSAVVTVGGPSTLLAAFSHGVPVVVVPFDWDHPETAWRVRESGAGIRMSPSACTPRAMRQAIEQLLTVPSFRQNAARLAATFERLGGPRTAASLLETLVTARSLQTERMVVNGCSA